MSASTALDGYTRIAPGWRAAGWPVLPVHRGEKGLDVKGFTGENGTDPTPEQHDEWCRTRPSDNAAVRMPEGVVGLDVDAYKPEGAASWIALLEECGGPPPETFIITSRTDETSGIRLYRLQSGAPRLKGAPRKGIEAIQRHHRYAMVPGSLHPEGRRYRLIGPDGEIANAIPSPDSLPILPDAWVAALAEPVREPGAPPVRRHAGDWSPSVTKAFADAVASLVEGSRHDTAKEAAAALARYEALEHPGATDALAALGSTFVAAITANPGSARHHGHDHQKEWDDLLDSARALVAGSPSTAPRWEERTDPFTGVAPTQRRNGHVAPPPYVDPETGEIVRLHLPDDFYDARPALAHISQAARARQRSRDAVFTVVLARVAAAVSHSVKLPAVVGSPAPLCYFGVTLAPPGSGKGDAAAIGTELIPVDDHVADQLPIGSGEGLAEVLFDFVTEDDNGKPVKVKKQVRHNAFVNIDEGDALAQLGTRSGSTLLSTLRSIWSGKTIGNTNAARENRRIVPAGQYTFGVIVGLQDTKAGPLLDDVDAGTPQRFGWAYAVDPELPDRAPAWPGPLGWHPPDDEALDVIRSRKPEGPTHLLRLHPDIEDEIRALDLARAKGEGPRDPWEAHSALLRLRIAALLAILDDRLHIHREDWALAGIVKATSDNVRTHAQTTVIAEASHKERQTSSRLANRAADADSAVRQRRIIDCAKKIADKVHNQPDDWTVSALRRRSRGWEDVFDDALLHAKIEGWIIERSEPGQGTDKRTIAPGQRRAWKAA